MSEPRDEGLSPRTWAVLVAVFRSSMYLAHYGLLLSAFLMLLPAPVRSEGSGPERFSDRTLVGVAIAFALAQLCHLLSNRWRWDVATGQGAVLLLFSLLFREWCGFVGLGQ